MQISNFDKNQQHIHMPNMCYYEIFYFCTMLDFGMIAW